MQAVGELDESMRDLVELIGAALFERDRLRVLLNVLARDRQGDRRDVAASAGGLARGTAARRGPRRSSRWSAAASSCPRASSATPLPGTEDDWRQQRRGPTRRPAPASAPSDPGRLSPRSGETLCGPRIVDPHARPRGQRRPLRRQAAPQRAVPRAGRGHRAPARRVRRPGLRPPARPRAGALRAPPAGRHARHHPRRRRRVRRPGRRRLRSTPPRRACSTCLREDLRGRPARVSLAAGAALVDARASVRASTARSCASPTPASSSRPAPSRAATRRTAASSRRSSSSIARRRSPSACRRRERATASTTSSARARACTRPSPWRAARPPSTPTS